MVVAAPAGQFVEATACDQAVVAGSTGSGVGPPAREDPVVPTASVEAPLDLVSRRAHGHVLGALVAAESIVVAFTVDRVLAVSAFDQVHAVAAAQDVVATQATDHVVAS